MYKSCKYIVINKQEILHIITARCKFSQRPFTHSNNVQQIVNGSYVDIVITDKLSFLIVLAIPRKLSAGKVGQNIK